MTSRRSATSAAAAVSATLRRGGLNPLGSGTSRAREGIRVSSAWTATRVGIDIDNRRLAESARAAAEKILRDNGYATERLDTGALLVRKGTR